MLDRVNDWRCPQLPVSPYEAIRLAQSIIGDVAPASLSLIGSSLGAFYATWLAEHYGCRAVLLNPATAPDETLDQYLGEQPLWHGGGTIVVKRRHLEELKALRVPRITSPERYYLIAATGDEVLDYRTMLRAYPDVATTVIQGSNHSISDFDDYLDGVLQFCGVDLGPAATEAAADAKADPAADTATGKVTRTATNEATNEATSTASSATAQNRHATSTSSR